MNTTTTYIFTYNTINPMAIGSSFILTYPITVTPSLNLTTVLVIYKAVIYPMGWKIDTDKMLIYIKRGLPIAIPVGA